MLYDKSKSVVSRMKDNAKVASEYVNVEASERVCVCHNGFNKKQTYSMRQSQQHNRIM